MPNTDKIQELAEKGRKRREQMAVEAAEAAMEQTREPPSEWGPGELASKALGGGWGTFLLLSLAAIVGLGLTAVLMAWMLRQGYSFTYVLGPILLVVVWFLCWMLSIVLYARSARREIDRLRSVPFFRDAVKSYVDQLDVASDSKRMRLEVVFASPLENERRQSFLDMILAIHAQTQAQWEEEKLVLLSPEIRTHFTSQKGGSRDDNRGVHKWFDRFLRDFLVPVNESVPVTRVRTLRAR